MNFRYDAPIITTNCHAAFQKMCKPGSILVIYPLDFEDDRPGAV